MKPEIKKLWVDALRSGEFTQGTGFLKTTSDCNNEKYCCLGVLCKLHGKETGRDFSAEDRYCGSMYALPIIVAEWADLETDPVVHFEESHNFVPLSTLNDGVLVKSRSFTEIADIIEKHL